ncbi:hypothetical protein HGRIS_002982 [Hohenbuehelia grisea]|uniref:Uncharacterized protein n=1 Tax=Hohenbuehelia grisea TaxID=104357 RepID=A0ABR3JMN0_9AGAR
MIYFSDLDCPCCRPRVFPGDEKFSNVEKGRMRFVCYQISESHYILLDARQETESEISKDLLVNPRFNAAHWYAKRLAHMHRISPVHPSVYLYKSHQPIGNAYEIATAHYLEINSPYKGDGTTRETNPCFQFGVEHVPEKDMYRIIDNCLLYAPKVPGMLLRNPKFNLKGWYEKSIERAYQFITETHLGPCADPDLRILFDGDDGAKERALDGVMEHLFSDYYARQRIVFHEYPEYLSVVELNGQQVQAGTYPAIQRNVTRDAARTIPRPSWSPFE